MPWENRDYYKGTSDHGFYPRFTGRSVTFWLILANVAVFVVDSLSARTMGRFTVGGGGLLTDLGHFSAAKAVFQGQVWRFLTFQFLHAGILHILFNMIALYFFGRIAESFLGSRRYLAFYLLSGVGGALLYLGLWGLGQLAHAERVPFLLTGDGRQELVGASAGVFGILVAVAVIAPSERFLFWFISVTFRTAALVAVGFSVFMLMINPEAGSEAAHLGGAALGYVLVKNSRWLAFADRLPSGAAVGASMRRRRRERAERFDADERVEVDRILDKVREHGLHSLTRGEKRALERATERQRRAG